MNKVYPNKTTNILSVKEIIYQLDKFNVDIILIGSEIGKKYGLCDFTKDIDFLINPSDNNIKNLFLFLQKFFSIQDLIEIMTLDRIVLKSKENKNIELFMMSSHNEIFPLKDYVKLKNNSNIMEYLGTKISALSLDDYIDSVHNNIINPFFKDSTTYNQKMKKYMNILTNYKTGVINGTFV